MGGDFPRAGSGFFQDQSPWNPGQILPYGDGPEPGVIGMAVTQICAQDTTVWNTPMGPATADADSPPVTPMPQVKVLPAP